MQKPVDCLKCKYHFVTWDPAHPKGCRFYGFKGRGLPSTTVLASSGEPCKAFEPKPRLNHAPEGIRRNNG